jgi:holin-like protein
MKTTLLLAAQLAALLVINQLGYAVAAALQIPLPGNLLGMLVLLALLATGLVPPRWVEASASLLLRHLAFFFVPITVGLMGFGDLFLANGPAIVVTLIVSAVVGLCVAGLSSQRLAARRDGKAS